MMSFSIKDLAIKAGAGVLTAIFPPAAALIPVVNQFLDEDEKLPDNATGDQVSGALARLTPEQLASVESKKIDLQITESNNWASVAKSLAEADHVGKSTRPQISMMMAWLVVVQVVGVVFCLGYSVVTKDKEVIIALSDSWEMLLATMGLPSILLRQYFGIRTQEKNARLSAAVGQEVNGGLLTALVKSKINK